MAPHKNSVLRMTGSLLPTYQIVKMKMVEGGIRGCVTGEVVLRLAVRGLVPLLALVPPAFGCSVPQWDPAHSDAPRSIPQLLDANHFRRALAQAAADPASTPQHAYLLSRIQLGFNHFDLAMELAEKAVAAEPNNAAFHLQIAAVAGRMAERASMFKQLSLAKRVRKELDQTLALDPKNPDALYGMMLFAEVAPSFLGGDRAKAQTLAEQLTAIDPPRGYIAQSTLAHDRHDTAAEEALLKKAVAVDANSYEAHIALATFYLKPPTSHADEADEEACQALYLDPTRAEAWQLLAEAAGAAGCLPEVEGLIASQQRFSPDDFSAAYAGAVGIIQSGANLEAARKLLNRYLEKPQEGNAPSTGQARYRLAVISEKDGQPDQAIDLLHMALNEDPTLEDARKDLKRLEHTGRTQ